ncbi:MAG: type II/IV secretion system ATPase subunit [Candidatus Nanohalobium sp.]
MNQGMQNLITRLQKLKHSENFEQKEEEEEGGINVPVPGEFSEEDVKQSQPKQGDNEEENRGLRDVDVTYPLTPTDPDEGETVYAWAHIRWDEREEELVYQVIEPERTQRVNKILQKVKSILERSFDVDFQELATEEAQDYLEEKIDHIIDKYDISLSTRERKIIRYYSKRDFVGLGKLQPLMNDTEVEDISCDGLDIPVYVDHRNPKFGSIKTTVMWREAEQLNSFVMKMAQRCGKSISVASPLLDGSLPDGSRVQATLATDIARKGSNFTIRRFTEDPLTPVHMMEFETENAQLLSYLWFMIEHEKSTLIAGTTGAGKTSQLNALSLFIKPEKKIVSIEDTPELRLPHDHWVPEVARSGFGSSAEEGGEVSLDNLLKESLRQRPEFIIVGEVRGEEAYILFQQMATGHTGMSTIHADSLNMLMDRLTTDPIDLSPSLIETLDVVMLISRIRRGDTYIRRIKGIYEIRDYGEERGLQANKVFGWNPKKDEYYQANNSLILEDIMNESTMGEEDIQKELRNRQHVMKYMKDQQIKHFEDVGDVISRYYYSPEDVLSDIGQTFNSEKTNIDT